LPSRPGFDGWLYVFVGEVALGDHRMTTHDAVGVIGGSDLTVTALADSDLVFFLVDRLAPASCVGTISGQ
jgi:quercetin 2,3-dioxygenase